jgi:hypothetical protein
MDNKDMEERLRLYDVIAKKCNSEKNRKIIADLFVKYMKKDYEKNQTELNPSLQ